MLPLKSVSSWITRSGLPATCVTLPAASPVLTSLLPNRALPPAIAEPATRQSTNITTFLFIPCLPDTLDVQCLQLCHNAGGAGVGLPPACSRQHSQHCPATII